MKKLIFILFSFVFFLITSNVFASMARENTKTSFTITSSTSMIVAVSSVTYTSVTYSSELKGVQRTIHIETPSLGVRCQVGGSTSTILTNGAYLDNNIWYINDVSCEPIYLQAPAGSSPVSVYINKLEK